MIDNVLIGNQICLLRKRNGFTQEELAGKLGVSPQAISKWENGYSLPETALLPLLAKSLNCSIDSILMPLEVKVGSLIPLGKYQWIVLKIEGERALILSECVIDQRPFHEEMVFITWEHCDLRKYLNTDFYNSFDPSERTRILETEISDVDNQWYGTKCSNPTVDKIFLLSVKELVEYFGDSGDLKNKKKHYWKTDEQIDIADGVESLKRGECIYDEFNEKRVAVYHKGWDARWYWLRSPGMIEWKSAASVGYKGEIFLCGDGVGRGDGGIRPALWINLRS